MSSSSQRPTRRRKGQYKETKAPRSMRLAFSPHLTRSYRKAPAVSTVANIRMHCLVDQRR